jgi:hypothetical protein
LLSLSKKKGTHIQVKGLNYRKKKIRIFGKFVKKGGKKGIKILG